MEVDGAGTSAWRRRQRRLRSWLRHERQTVAMELAAALHHSRDVGPGTHAGLRAQKAASSREEAGVETHHALRGLKTLPPGMRPEQLPEAPGPQRCDRTVRGISVGAPLLAVQSLRGFDGVDNTAAKFLLQQALKLKKEEEEEEKREKARKEKEAQEKADLELAKRDPWYAQHLFDMKVLEEYARRNKASSSSKRKRKKRRKRRTPRTSSLPGRARRRQRQCHVPLRPVVDVPVVRFSSNDEICADNFIFFSRFKLNGKGRSEQWVVFLYCDKTIKVDRDYAAVLPWGVPLPDIGGVGFGSSPNLDTKYTIYELFLPSIRDCVTLSCGGGFCSPVGAYDSVWDRVQPMTGKYFVYSFQYQGFAGCVCMLNVWFSSNDEVYADNYIYFRFKLQGRSEKWELYLYGDMTIKVDRDSVEVLPRGVPPFRLFTIWQRITPSSSCAAF